MIEALKSGGETAFKEMLNHPAASIIIATAHGWAENDVTESTKNTANN